METKQKNFSFAVFPFLKTSGSVSIGQLTFRPTGDTEGLSADQAASIGEIAGMLFLKDNLHIRSATYAVIPFVDLNAPTVEVDYLKRIQAFVAYLYASPRHEFGDLFLSSEHASIVIFSPGQVSFSLVNPDSNVEVLGTASDLKADERGEVEGYSGLYNFRHHFWLAKGSRLYGPKPHLTLNYSQDLRADVDRVTAARIDYQLLSELLLKPSTERSSRIFTAVQWFNAANNEGSDEATAIVDLSIAFEALLNLPADEKTDRLMDSIALLLGRTPRLDIWVKQFYNARSQVVHEGLTDQLRFIATDSLKVNKGPLYQSLLSYGRQIFQLCLGTLLAGADLAESARLAEKFVTNQERFQNICKILSDETLGIDERLERIAPIVAAIRQYQYVPESHLQIDPLLGATRLAAKTLLERDKAISKELKEHLEQIISAKQTDDHLIEIDAVQTLNNFFKRESAQTINSKVVSDLFDIVWNYVFMYYYWRKRHPADETKGASGPGESDKQP